MRRWRARRLRVRLLAVVGTAVAVGLAAGGLALYAALTLAVNRTLDASALAAAREVAALADAGRLPNPVPVTGAEVIQVIDAQGRVVSGSATADRLTPLLRPAELARARDGEAVTVSGARTGIRGPLRVRAVPAGTAANPLTVLVAVRLGDVLASRSVLRTALAVTIPLLLGVLALVTWRVIGSTLRPVEELRRGAERISGSTQAERLPVPAADDEVRALALTLNAMLDRLAEARARQQAFVADAAHELRSPLTSLRVSLEVAEHLGEASPPPAELLSEVNRLSRLVEDLLLLARVDADVRGPAAPMEIDVGKLLSEVARANGSARVPVRARPGGPGPGELGLVFADRGELRRAVDSLVDNAIRHARTEVELAAAAEPGHLVLTVTDDGPGISVEDRERVFERFARLDDARARDAGGSGLGLAIARELVTRAGGTLRFGEDGDGRLQAQIRLPRRSAGADQPPQVEAPHEDVGADR